MMNVEMKLFAISEEMSSIKAFPFVSNAKLVV